MAIHGIKKIDNLETLSGIPFEGYVWLSDAKTPIVLHENTFDFAQHQGNPFIIEALLFDPTSKKSIHITHDGAQHIVEYDLTTLKNGGFEIVNKEYMPHRMEGVERLHFVQLWKDEEDELCNNFMVKTLKATVFCGFKKFEL
jgi:CRISPR type III-associated protein (TIGR04423 family)